MSEVTRDVLNLPAVSGDDLLSSLLQEGAQRMLAQEIEAEVEGYLSWQAEFVNEAGHRQVVSNGYMPRRTILAIGLKRKNANQKSVFSPL
jgi:hypothetical protein